MKSNFLIDFSADRENNQITVKREFGAPVEKVWAAWTQSEILDQWWAPSPWKARTKEMNFTEGGHWLYAMVGSENQEHWSRADYKAIISQKSFSASDSFTDSDGVVTDEFPRSEWQVSFDEESDTTVVNIALTYESLADLENTLKMGFREGFLSAMENLDAIFSKY